MKKGKIIRKILGGTLAGALLFLTACSSGGATDVVKIGVTGDSKTWNYVSEIAAAEGITIELVKFTDYPQPNKALDAGEIQINSFQHYAYLDKEVEEFGYEIQAIAETTIAPMGIYSDKLTKIAEVQALKSAKVLIPDDVTNGGRAIKLLEEQGLIKVDPAAGKTPTLKDITDNPLGLEITELAAANIPAALPDVDYAAINSGVAADAIGTPSEKSIILEEVATKEGNPYINVIVVRNEDVDNPTYKRLIEIYQSDEVKAIITEDSKGSSIPVW